MFVKTYQEKRISLDYSRLCQTIENDRIRLQNTRGIFQNSLVSYERVADLNHRQTDDKTNPPRGGDSGKFLGCK